MKLISLSGKHGKGKFATVDDDVYPELSQYKWRVHHSGYAIRTAGEQGARYPLFMHTLIIDCPHGMVRDHINRDKLDNRKGNLRVATHRENVRNADRVKRNGDDVNSIYYGVTWVTFRKKWQAQAGYRGRNIWLGYYSNEAFAAFVVNMFYLLIGSNSANYTPYHVGLYP